MHYFIHSFQTQQVHAVLQGLGQDPRSYTETPEHAGQTGPQLPGVVHSDAVP